MKYLIILLNLFVCVNMVSAHEPNEAFFTFNVKDNMISVEAELPWSMRNALIEFNPKLSKSSTKQDFEKTFVEYIKQNLILKDEKGSVLEFQNFKELPNHGHSHQNNYLLHFKGNNLSEVINKIMFNLYPNQKNHHTIQWNNKQFETNKDKTSYHLENDKSFDFGKYKWLIIIPIVLILLVLIKKITAKNNSKR